MVKNKRTISDPVSEVTVIAPAAVVNLPGAAVPAEEGAKELVVGRVRTYRRGVLSIEVPGERRPRVMQAKLTPDAAVRFSIGAPIKPPTESNCTCASVPSTRCRSLQRLPGN